MIPNFKTYLKESHWSEMNRRSQGITARKEDDVNLMNDDMFFEYLIKRYWRPNEKIQDLDRDHYSREFDKDIVVDPIKGCVIYGSYKDGELKRIFIVYRDKKLEKMLKSYQGKFIFTPSKPGTTLNKRYYVTGKDDQVSNKLFVDLIELFLSYSENETLKESHWSEMNRRSQGITVRKENNVNSLDCADFFEYLKNRYKEYCSGNYIYRNHNYIKFYLEPGCPLHIRYNDDGKTVKEITTELFDSRDSFSNFEAELESKNVRHNLTADFNGSNTLEIKDKNGNTSNRTVIEFIDNYFNYVIDGDGHKILFKICDKLRPDYEKGEKITLDKIIDLAKHELVVNRYPAKTRFFNFIEKNYDDIIYIIQNNIGINESHWSEMNRRSQGITVRKEDDVDKLDLGEFYKYLIGRYESICGNKISISFTSITMPLLCGKAIANLSIRHYNYIFTICMYEKDMSSDFLNSLEEKYYVNIDDWFQGFKNIHLSPKGKSKGERLANHDFVKIIDDILDMDKPHGLNNAIKRKY